ncbi:MAG: TrmH family RNA methyltransferase [Myxococcota bacterium]
MVKPSHPGNIGAVARAMKTMDLSRLVLVQPKEFPAYEAERRAMDAVDILAEAKVVDHLSEAVADCRTIIGGTARARSHAHPVKLG